MALDDDLSEGGLVRRDFGTEGQEREDLGPFRGWELVCVVYDVRIYLVTSEEVT